MGPSNNVGIHMNGNLTAFYLSELRYEYNSQLASCLNTLTHFPRMPPSHMRTTAHVIAPIHCACHIHKTDYPTYITIFSQYKIIKINLTLSKQYIELKYSELHIRCFPMQCCKAPMELFPCMGYPSTALPL